MSASVFPARAGMSRGAHLKRALVCSVPRASGDEPHYAKIQGLALECSPRERG